MEEVNEKDPWQIAAARYCVENAEKGITRPSLEDFLRHSGYVLSSSQVQQFWEEEVERPAGREFRRYSINSTASDSLWCPPLDLVSKMTDFDELREARRNAVQATKQANKALIVSIISLMISAISAVVTIVHSP